MNGQTKVEDWRNTERQSIRTKRHRLGHLCRLLVRLMALLVLAQSVVLFSPSNAGAEGVSGGWLENDAPLWGHRSGSSSKAGWRGGDGQRYGHGVGRYYGNSNYAYASAADGWKPAGSRALWTFETNPGVYDIEVYVPCKHATAIVKYHVGHQGDGNYTHVGTGVLHQHDHCGWTVLDNWQVDGENLYVFVNYDDSRVAAGKSGHLYRSVGMDAVRIRRATFNCMGDLIEEITVIWRHDYKNHDQTTKFSVSPSSKAEDAPLQTPIYDQFIDCIHSVSMMEYRTVAARTADGKITVFNATDTPKNSPKWATFKDQLNCHDFPPFFVDASETWDLEGFRKPEQNRIVWLKTLCNWNGGSSSS